MMSKSKRLTITWVALIFLISTTYIAIHNDLETVATTCIAGVMTILSTYIWAETKRPTEGKE
tara:strand:+ start:344 stop:529 length:186 start_codon:yes stop_codon:yes gene_type:complete